MKSFQNEKKKEHNANEIRRGKVFIYFIVWRNGQSAAEAHSAPRVELFHYATCVQTWMCVLQASM